MKTLRAEWFTSKSKVGCCLPSKFGLKPHFSSSRFTGNLSDSHRQGFDNPLQPRSRETIRLRRYCTQEIATNSFPETSNFLKFPPTDPAIIFIGTSGSGNFSKLPGPDLRIF